MAENKTVPVFASVSPITFEANFTTCALLACVVAIGFYYWKSTPKGLPPGPIGLPFLGYLPFVASRPHETFSKLAKKYGPVFSLYFGNTLIVVLNSYEAIKEAFVKQGDTFTGRPDMQFVAGEHDNYSVGLANGDVWKAHRGFTINFLRKLGVGKHSIEPLLMDEIQHFLGELEKFNGEPSDFSELLNASISNNICIMIFGKRFAYDDRWFVQSRRAVTQFVANSSAVGVLQFYPWLSKLPGMAKIMNQGTVIQLLKYLKESLYVQISERKMSYIDGQNGNYIDAFIGEQKARKDNYGNEDDTFSDTALEQNVRTLMLGGTETTVNTLLWCIICMVMYPEVQKKVQKEIDEVIGSERSTLWSDRLRTPYTEAVICEVQRYLTMLPINLARKNITECELFGYKIPKDTTILSNQWSVHNDVTYWKNPEVFLPERFLSANGKVDKKEYLITFSMGKRDCIGISLARMELYLYFTSMLQKFAFRSPDGTEPSMEVRAGFTTAPKYFNTRAIIRTH